MTQISNFSKKIINWYIQHGRKTLPWQIKKTPYTVWISEIMLQQTQMTRVIPYFQHFTNKFPNIKKLANSKLDTVLHLWSGLGFYTRAHNLHNTAKIIVNKHNAVFPDSFKILTNLPGIGRSTAGAILSLSLEQKYPILDSNVKRILSRYYTIHGYPGSNTTEKKLWNLIEKIIPNKDIAKFNQGIMDLGEIICTIKYPKCNLCPISQTCQSNINNETHLYPNKKSHKTIQKKNIWFLILQYKNKIWIEQCPLGKIWGGLFCFPQFSTEKKLYNWLLQHNLNIYQDKKLSNFQHKFTHYSVNITPIILYLKSILYVINNGDQQNGLWFDLKQPNTVGFPKPMIQLLKIIHPI